MNKELHVEIISPEGYLFNGNCNMVVVPAYGGEMGIMAGHEAILSSLIPGVISIHNEKQNVVKEFQVSSGTLQIQGSKLLILVDK